MCVSSSSESRSSQTVHVTFTRFALGSLEPQSCGARGARVCVAMAEGSTPSPPEACENMLMGGMLFHTPCSMLLSQARGIGRPPSFTPDFRRGSSPLGRRSARHRHFPPPAGAVSCGTAQHLRILVNARWQGPQGANRRGSAGQLHISARHSCEPSRCPAGLILCRLQALEGVPAQRLSLTAAEWCGSPRDQGAPALAETLAHHGRAAHCSCGPGRQRPGPAAAAAASPAPAGARSQDRCSYTHI